MAELEHVNITVSDPSASAQLYADLFNWQVRWQGKSQLGGETVHVGSKTQYLAVYAQEGQDPAQKLNHRKGRPLNHFGVVVDDLAATEQRVLKKGLKTFSHGDYEPGRRFYFFDPDGVEVEVISYHKKLRDVLDYLPFK